jgi:uncharacterized membrane protein SpoIIM required for sporulation
VNEEWFEQRFSPGWAEFELLLAELDTGRGERAPELPRRYRQLCAQLALARSRRLSAHLVDRLQHLVAGGHRQLYAAPRLSLWSFAEFAARGFPRAVRAQWKLVGFCALLLFGPGVGLALAIQARPELAFSVLDRDDAARFEEMYDPAAERSGRARDAGSDVMMFGFYVRNNVGIALQTFGSGALLVLAPLVLLFNGVLLGAVAGHLTHAGYGETFWPFVVGHGAPELIAIALAGAAGIRLGLALLVPGQSSRQEALRAAALEALPIIVGSAGLLLIAALLEAFWSGRGDVPAGVRFAVGGMLWTALVGYLALAGRTRAA